jgi:hypothetical protein
MTLLFLLPVALFLSRASAWIIKRLFMAAALAVLLFVVADLGHRERESGQCSSRGTRIARHQ